MKYKKLKGGDVSKGGLFHAKGKKREQETKEIQELCSKYDSVESAGIETFQDIPLSARTQKGLAENNYTVPTVIQKESIILALRGKDVLGAAKTGSGKTLAFLIPVLETLYRQRWSSLDGVGALIITPTRELALQIYEALVKVGKYHEFSAGLIIGGKDLKFEKSRMHQVNIVICTPGRLLQHMDENPLFNCVNMQVLVLDEADRCLDMGFERDMNSIIENLPSQRQTLLFSATQTKKVSDLARLSLTNPEYVAVHEHEKFKTPDGLTQSYIVCGAHEKVPILWSFIKAHSRQKIMIFLATCNEVKYIHDVFKKLRPKNPVLALQGKMHQLKRMEIYHTFCRKEYAVLFATDIAARGLDFPCVDWVVQGDCPEDVDAYVHRVGRTARYTRTGESLLLVTPKEASIVEKLQANRIPVSEIKVNPEQIISPQAKLELFMVKSGELKASAQRAFVSYFKSVFLMKDKSIFDVKSIDGYQFARSLGLIAAPRVRFIQRMEKKGPQKGKGDVHQEDEDVEVQTIEIGNVPKEEKDFNFNEGDDSGDSDSEMFAIKRKDHNLEKELGDDLEPEKVVSKEVQPKPKVVLTKAKMAKKILKKNLVPNKKIIFTEDGEEVISQMKQKVTEVGQEFEASQDRAINLEEAKKTLEEEDIHDRKLYAELGRQRKREKKLKKKGKKRENQDEEEGSESDNSGSEPDLSWLPDPEEVYGDQEDSTAEDDGASQRLNDQPDNASISIKKEKKKNMVGKKRKRSERGSDEESEGELGLSLGETEDLALKLITLK